MSDLINREDVIKCLQENGWLDDTNIDELIETIPTAYSVEKVVEELEADSSVKLYGSGNSDNYLIPIKRAIEIVKQGGVSDDVCEWKIDGVYLHSPHNRPFVTCISDDEDYRYNYCPVCGKKIKVVE